MHLPTTALWYGVKGVPVLERRNLLVEPGLFGRTGLVRCSATGRAHVSKPLSSWTTTYLGHRIDIEPFEWGYLAHIVESSSNRELVAVNASVMKALESAFDLIDQTALPSSAKRRSSARPQVDHTGSSLCSTPGTRLSS